MGDQTKLIPMNGYDEVLEMVQKLGADATKFYSKGNKAAGTRLRVGLMKVSKMCKGAKNEAFNLQCKRNNEQYGSV